MNCEQMTVLLSAWLDGELSGEEQRQMQEHLEQCPECRAMFEQLQTLHTSFSDLEEIPAPEHFADTVMDRIKAESKPKVVPLFKRPQVRSFTALAACAMLFVGFGRFALGGGSKSEAAPAAAAPESVLVEAADAQTAVLGSAPEEYSLEAPAECAPETESTVEEPAAPEMTVQPTQGEARMDADQKIGADPLQGGEGQIVLHTLPEGLEEELGQLAWEERLEDGAQCARLTADQAQKLMDLIAAQGLEAERIAPEEGAQHGWMLVWLSN